MNNLPKLAAALVNLFVVGLFPQSVLGETTNLHLPSRGGQPVEVTLPEDILNGQRDDYSVLLQVFVGTIQEFRTSKLPIAGRYTREKDMLRFTPQFPFVEGQAYHVQLLDSRTEEKNKYTFFEFNISAPEPIKPEITHVFPSGNLLPENTLRFYLHFSTPMQPHVAFDYISLVDPSGHIDKAAFMQFKHELWSEDRKRLTILLDPGRLKRGVKTNRDQGPALLAGKSYQLRIKEGWPTASGTQATQTMRGFSKSFTVCEALRTRPDTKAWRVTPPTAESRAPLRIHVDRPFDYHLLHRAITIRSAEDTPILGDITVTANESQWQFTPTKPWQGTSATLYIDSRLEDVAGNNFQEALDRPLGTETKNSSHLLIPFTFKTKTNTSLDLE